MHYSYVAIDLRGDRKQGVLEARSPEAVHSQLKTSGLTAVSVEKDYFSTFLSYLPFRKSTLKDKETLEFVSFLADFLASGMDMMMALENLESVAGTRNTETAAREVRTLMSRGSSLSEAMKKSGLFPVLVYSATYAGEQAGELGRALKSLEEWIQTQVELRRDVAGALTYPIFIMVLLSVVVSIYLLYVMPQMQGVIEMTGYTPTATRIVFSILGFFRTFWWLFPGGIFAAVVGAAEARRRIGDERVEIMIRSMPLLGPVFISISCARIFFNFNLLFKAGMNVKEALFIAAEAESSKAMKAALARVREGIIAGKTVSGAFRMPPFPDSIAKMLEVGEKAGLLERYAAIVASFFKKEVDRRLKRILGVLQPAMLIVAASFIVLVFFAFIMPMYQSIISLSTPGGIH